MTTATATADIATGYAHVVKTPGMMSGEPRVEGTRIRVSDIVARRAEGLPAEQIASQECYPSLSLAQVYSALAYFEDHQEEIEGYFREVIEFADRLSREHPQLVIDRRRPSAAE